jgi:hypothetical protein
MNKQEKIKQINFYRMELFYLIFTVLISLMLVMCLNGWYDPDGIYRSRYASFQRKDQGIKVEILAAKYLPSSAAILGSSLSNRANIFDQGNAWGGSLVNLAGAHNHAAEQKEAAKQAIANGAKVVMWELMFNIMKPPDTKKDMWAYAPTVFEQIYYLRDASTLSKSLLVLLGRSKVGLSIDDFSEYHKCDECVYGRKSMVSAAPPFLTAWNKGKRFQDVTEFSVTHALRSHVLPIIRENPRITFKLFFPPISVFGSIDIDRRMRKVGFSMAQFREVALRELIDEPNVEMYDFQSDSVLTENLENYSDIIHYEPGINTKLVADMRSVKGRLSRESTSIAARNFDILLMNGEKGYVNFINEVGRVKR